MAENVEARENSLTRGRACVARTRGKELFIFRQKGTPKASPGSQSWAQRSGPGEGRGSAPSGTAGQKRTDSSI